MASLKKWCYTEELRSQDLIGVCGHIQLWKTGLMCHTLVQTGLYVINFSRKSVRGVIDLGWPDSECHFSWTTGTTDQQDPAMSYKSFH
jgi:hypothetical protein